MGLLQFARQLWIYSLWSLEALFFLPLLTILFFGSLTGLAAAFVKQRPFQHPLWKKSHWLVLTQILFFPVVISIGILYPASGPSFQRPESTASHVCDALALLSLALAAFWVFRMKGIRWFALCLVIVLQLILLGAFFVAGMAISGHWL